MEADRTWAAAMGTARPARRSGLRRWGAHALARGRMKSHSSAYELRLKGISGLDLFAIWSTQIDGSPQVRGTLGIHTVASVSS